MYFFSAQVASDIGNLGFGGAILLIIAGLILVGFEIFLPGMICGLLGGIALLAGVGVAFYTGGMVGGAVALLGIFVASIFGFWFYVKILPNTKLGGKLFLGSAIEGAGADAPGDDSLIGKNGTAQTVLAPSGVICVGDTHYEAVSRDGFIERGENVTVLARETLRLVVGKT